MARVGTCAFDVVLDLSWGCYSFSKTSFSSKKLNLKNSVTLDSVFYYQIKAENVARKEGSQIGGGGGEGWKKGKRRVGGGDGGKIQET